MSDSLQPHGLQHARLPCPSATPRAYSNSYPLSQQCQPTISSSAVPFPSHLQSLPASGSFQMSQFFASGGQNSGVSASTSVLPMNIQDWFLLGWTGWISLQSKGLLRVSPTPQFKCINSSALSLLHSPTRTSVHIEDPKDSTRKLLDLINEFTKFARYKINAQKSLAVLYTNYKRAEREIKETIPFTITTIK